jgi:hypothetical protein
LAVLRFVDARNETAAFLRPRASGAQIAASKACPELVEELVEGETLRPANCRKSCAKEVLSH